MNDLRRSAASGHFSQQAFLRGRLLAVGRPAAGDRHKHLGLPDRGRQVVRLSHARGAGWCAPPGSHLNRGTLMPPGPAGTSSTSGSATLWRGERLPLPTAATPCSCHSLQPPALPTAAGCRSLQPPCQDVSGECPGSCRCIFSPPRSLRCAERRLAGDSTAAHEHLCGAGAAIGGSTL